MLRRTLLAAVASLVAIAGSVQAQQYPARPVTMIIPFAAGGPTDVLGRVMAQRMSEILGQQVVVENVAGAGGMLGAQRVAQARPDGYQFVLGTVGTHAVNQTLYVKPLYDAATDFQPVALIAEVPLVLITKKDLPPNNLAEFITHVRANQAKMSFASAGNGSAVHLGCLLLNSVLGTNVEHIPYRGSAPALQDLTAGTVDFMCEIVSTALPQIQAGQVKPIATLTKGRSPVLPNLPTAHENGLPEFEAYTWNAFYLPKGTPADVVARLRQATIDAMVTPAVRERLQGIGATLVGPERTTPEYLANFTRSEITKWAAPITASGVKVE
ncbi:MAG: Bug family tripartite tricarboxylate transporter substrate binding protein [Rhodospirillales bacterium]|jgi:tripartite-type tricarboxylate transporter receptor subunit TctC